MFMWHRHGGWLGVAFAHARSRESRLRDRRASAVDLGPWLLVPQPRARVRRRVLLPVGIQQTRTPSGSLKSRSSLDRGN